MSSHPGEIRFGNYRVEEELRSGVVSTTYKAVHEPLGKHVAIKTLNMQLLETSSFADHLDREAKVLADLAHPNVVLLLEAKRLASGRPYLVLEYVDGWSLHDLLAKKHCLGVDVALAVAIGICAGLDHAHERGIVHRDIKPSNVLLAKSGTVKIIDFGIAQRTRSERVEPETENEAFGTPAYMSPEQILGDFVDGRSDLFSLGVVLYEMLAGSRPFDAASAPRPVQRIRRDAPLPLSGRVRSVPRSVERVVMHLLEKSPDDRYANAGIALDRLRAALRSITKEDPSMIVRNALIEAGLLEGKVRRKEATLGWARACRQVLRRWFSG
ncbi:MAG: serine/threonine protein kinase [Polyangiaceae bacterium]|nr:serine/threonine protein kinase [Polyangiaceae bacterium]